MNCPHRAPSAAPCPHCLDRVLTAAEVAADLAACDHPPAPLADPNYEAHAGEWCRICGAHRHDGKWIRSSLAADAYELAQDAARMEREHGCPHVAAGEPWCPACIAFRDRAAHLAVYHASDNAVLVLRLAACEHDARVALEGGGWWCAYCGTLGGPGGTYEPAHAMEAKRLDGRATSEGAPPAPPAAPSGPKIVN